MKNPEERLCAIQAEMEEIRARLKALPDGELRYYINGGSMRYFRKITEESGKKKRVYLNRGQRELAGQLAEKRYLTERMRDLAHEMKALHAYRRHYGGVDHARLLLEKADVYRELLHEKFRPVSEELAAWAEGNYTSTLEKKENLNVKSPRGFVRSKSESMIAWELYEKKVPYHYEEDHFISGTVLHPDFTIRHPETGKVFLWEHFGLMDNPQYARNALLKVQTYISAGYVPMMNLIVTSETASEPLDMELVKMLVRHFFL